MAANDTRAVSVVIPVFRAERYVEQAARSVLEQAEVLEVLLVEDGSPDGSLAACRRLAGEYSSRVRLLRHPGGVNRGAGASRNLGISEAAGRYIAFLDADDYCLPGRFSAAMRLLEADPSLDGVYEAVGVAFDSEEAGREWSGSGAGLRLLTVARPPAPEDLAAALMIEGRGQIHADGVLVRRGVFEKVGGFDEGLRLGQDRAMWWKLALACRMAAGNVESPVACYRRHAGNRAVNADPEFVEAGPNLAFSVYRWAKGRGLDAARIRLARAGLICELLRGPDPRMSKAALRWLQFRRLASWGLRHPRLLAERYLWSRAVKAGRAGRAVSREGR